MRPNFENITLFAETLKKESNCVKEHSRILEANSFHFIGTSFSENNETLFPARKFIGDHRRISGMIEQKNRTANTNILPSEFSKFLLILGLGFCLIDIPLLIMRISNGSRVLNQLWNGIPVLKFSKGSRNCAGNGHLLSEDERDSDTIINNNNYIPIHKNILNNKNLKFKTRLILDDGTFIIIAILLLRSYNFYLNRKVL